MRRYLFLILSAILILGSLGQKTANTQDNLLILTPHTWLAGYDQTILVDLFDNAQAQNVVLDLFLAHKEDSTQNFSTTINLGDQKFMVANFQVPTNLSNGAYNLTIEAKGADGFYFRNVTKDIELRSNLKSYFITTNKPTYRASETVLARVVGLDRKLLPLQKEDNVSVYLIDPNNNRINQMIDLSFENGLIDSIKFKLADRPILGTWLIKLEASDYEIAQPFSVMEYVLPKYEVSITTDEYLLRGAKEVAGLVEAKYTYGQPVDGQVLVRVEAKDYFYHYAKMRDPGSNKTNLVNEHLVTLEGGKGNFKVSIAINNAHAVNINATVKDRLTSEQISKTTDLSVFDYPFYASINPQYFTLNKLNTFTLTMTNPLSRPLGNTDFVIEIRQFVEVLEPQPPTKTYNGTTDINGGIKVLLDVADGVNSVEFNVRFATGSAQSFTLNAYKWHDMYYTTHPTQNVEIIAANMAPALNSQEKIIFKRVNESVPCAKNVKYIIVGRSMIVQSGSFDQCQGDFELDLNITTLFTPSFNVIAYYLNQTSYLHVRNLEVNVNGLYENAMSLAFDRAKAEPGESVNLKVKASPGSKAAVSVVDQSVMLMGKTNDLTEEQVFGKFYELKLSPYYPTYEPEENNQGARMFMGYDFWESPEPKHELQNNGLISFSTLECLRMVKRNYTYMAMFAPPMVFKEMQPVAAEADAAMAFRPAADAAMGGGAVTTPTNNNLVDTTRVRSDFSETWLWDTVLVGETGEANITSIIPDTITSWVATGFALSNVTGLGIANKTQIIGFKGFFVSMILPASLIRGELLVLQVVVRNYLDADLKNVLVTFAKNSDFKRVVIKNGNQTFENIDSDITMQIPELKAGTGSAVSFIITPASLGKLSLSVKAQSSVAADAEKKTILVKAEGVEKSYTLPQLIDLRSSSNLVLTKAFSKSKFKLSKIYNNAYEVRDFELSFPNETVADSQFCSVQLIGDILGPAFSNLNNLITKPYGCGEQNMLTLTPNIYAVRYMLFSLAKKSKARNLVDLINTAKSNIQYGYQNQLKYQRRDGSFSAFGETDNNGSSWLTAFVVKSFSQAREYANIDPDVLSRSVAWLMAQQRKDGSFAEPGDVIHKDMQGGVNSNITISAYITISLLESKLESEQLSQVINKSLGYLQSQLVNQNKTLDTYALTLITYAFNLASSTPHLASPEIETIADDTFELFNNASNSSVAGQLYWSMPTAKPEKSHIYWFDYETPSSDIEMTSYGVLTYLLRSRVSESMSIVRWLVSKSNSLGSYSSTQNTVLALQGLSEFAHQLLSNHTGKLDMSVNVTLNFGNGDSSSIKKLFSVNEDNALVLQTWELPKCPVSLRLSSNGSGLVSFQTIVAYNVPKQKPEPVFKLSQRIAENITINNLLLETCVSYEDVDPATKENKTTGMSVIESTLLGGFEADKTDLTAISKNQGVKSLKLVEITKDNRAVFYFNKLDSSRVCFKWKITRKYPIANLQPVPVKVYDYYQPDVQSLILFSAPDGISDICQLATSADCHQAFEAPKNQPVATATTTEASPSSEKKDD